MATNRLIKSDLGKGVTKKILKTIDDIREKGKQKSIKKLHEEKHLRAPNITRRRCEKTYQSNSR